MEFSQVATIAGKEFWDRIRNRWVLAVALVFTVFALSIAYFGSAQQGAVGFRSIEVTIASLVSLVIYLIPLIALVLGFDAIVGERERGSLDLLLSMPITRLELLLGKYLGLAGALTFSTVAGFGLVGVVLSSQLDLNALFHYFGFMISSVLLGCAFLSLAVMLSVFAADRTRASGLAIAMWFFFVLIFDLLVLGVLVVTAGQWGGEALPHVLQRCVFAHGSAEPGHAHMLAHLLPGQQPQPLLDLGLRLGEGSGAALAWPLLQSACAVLREMASFEAAGVATQSV